MDGLELQSTGAPSASESSCSGAAAHRLSSASTDNIFPPPRPVTDHDASAWPHQQPLYLDSDSLPFSTSEVSLPSVLLSSSVNGDVELTGRATIAIALLDASPPVLVWTSLNSWQTPFEMTASGTDSAGGQIYTCQIDNVPEQAFHYKVQAGDKWVLDDEEPTAQDQNGHINNLGHAQCRLNERAASAACNTPAAAGLSLIQHEIQRAGNQNIQSSPVQVPPLQSGYGQTGMTLVIGGPAAAYLTYDDDEETLDPVEPGSETEQQAPLLRHESFQEDLERPRKDNALRRGSRLQSLPMSTIQEESSTDVGNDAPESQSQTTSSLDQARKYQRALIEAMPSSIANGFTRASVFLPVGSSGHASEFGNAPLLRHETMSELTPLTEGEPKSKERDGQLQHPLMGRRTSLGHVAEHQQQDTDELDQAPLFRHETNVAFSTNDSMDELDQAPLLRHETYSGSPAHGPHDELAQAPLMRFETNLDADATDIDNSGHRLSHDTTLVGDGDDGTYDELVHAPLLRHETEPGLPSSSTQSTFNSEQMVSPLDSLSSNIRPSSYRSSSVYSNDRNELDRAPTLAHEAGGSADQHSCFDHNRAGYPPAYAQGAAHCGLEDCSDDNLGGELDRAPTMSHETNDSLFLENPRADELGADPILPHEAGYPDASVSVTGWDGASSDQRGMDCMNDGEDALLSTSRTNSITSERLREAFKTRIFGATRLPMVSQNSSVENELDSGGAPLLAHERTIPINDRSRSDSLSSRGGNLRQRTNDNVHFSLFANRNPSIFPAQRSSLPHRMPQRDEDDFDLHDPSLEIFPVDRDAVFNRVIDIGNRLPEDQVPFPVGGIQSPAIESQSCSSVDLVPIRTSSTMSLQSIREDASEDGIGQTQLPSPVLMLASRVPKLSSPSPTLMSKGEDMITPMSQGPQVGYFESKDDAGVSQEGCHAHAPVSRPLHGPGTTSEEFKRLEGSTSKRHGRVFDDMVFLPKPAEKNIALPPNQSTDSFVKPGISNESGESKKRARRPHPSGKSDGSRGYKESNIARSIYAPFRACFSSRIASMLSISIVVAGAAWWYKRWI